MRRFVPCLALIILSACEPPKYQPPPTPAPTPTPSVTPTPLPTPTPTPTIPRKPIDVAQLFNGITLFTKFETPQSAQTASIERDRDESYKVQVTFTANLPAPSVVAAELARNDPKLPEVLTKLPRLLDTARVSPYFERLYQNKIEFLRDRLNRLDLLLSRHNFYDCETILELQDPDTGRKALLIQGDMDVNSDGSDGDRNFPIDATSSTFQPQTSYRWNKLTDRPNPCLPIYENKLAALKQELSLKGLSPERNRELKRQIDETTRIISELQSKSFLISDADPSIVVPSFMAATKNTGFSPAVGDFAAVIYNGRTYPAIVGDLGPSNKVGEASARLCKEINPKASALSRAVNNIKVTYLIFPGTAEKPGQPDVLYWREKCKQFLDEIGGTIPELHRWEDIVPPWPTPTPTPTPISSPAPALPSPSPSPSSSPPSSPFPSPIPSPTPTPFATPAIVPIQSPSPSPDPSRPDSSYEVASPSPNSTPVAPSVVTTPENSSP
ncbi:MAG TPA: glycoside hydrolase family 75 protein [Terrimicrobiaceae bacterium]